MRGSPFGKVQPDDDPQAYCTDCGNKYNPYKHGLDCPKCSSSNDDTVARSQTEPSRQSADDVPVVDPSDYVD